MSLMTCSLCGTGFSARSDAVYCSPACRQKAHRARTSRRTAELRERLTTLSRGRGVPETSRSLQRAVARSMQRAHEQVNRSRELCRLSQLRLQESKAISRTFVESQADGAWLASSDRALWLSD
ncbi:MAG: hypothetical protein ACXVYI_00500 [Mycobacterium sp.]